MNCKKCGFQLAESDTFCKTCGAKVELNNELNNFNGKESGIEQTNNAGQGQMNPFQQQFGTPNTQPMEQQIVQQPINQPMGQNTYQQQNYNNQQDVGNNKTKKPKKKKIIIGIISFILILLTTYFVAGWITNKINSANTVKVVYAGFEFPIPKNMLYEIGSTSLNIYDKEETWHVKVAVSDASTFLQILIMKNEFLTILKKDFDTAENMQEKKYSGTNFLTIEASTDGRNGLHGYTQGNLKNVLLAIVETKDNNFDYSLFKKIAPILANAEYVGEE